MRTQPFRSWLVLAFAMALVLPLVAAPSQTGRPLLEPVARLAVIAGAPHGINSFEYGDDLFVSLDELFAALGWRRCDAGSRCVAVPQRATSSQSVASPAGGSRRTWRVEKGKVEALGGIDFASVRQLEAIFGLRAGWDRVDRFLWVLPPDPPLAPSRIGPNITIPAKQYGPFDAHGIPMKDHGEAGTQYNPLVVLEYGTVYFRMYLDTGDQKYLAAFLRMVDWLEKSAVPIPGFPETAAWYYDFDWPPFAKKPFIAAITQSYAGSAFVDAYVLTGEPRYLAKARHAMAVLRIPVLKGGVYSTDRRGGYPYLEEYPSDPPSRVLGGCADTVLRLGRYLQFDNDALLKEVYLSTIRTILESLPLYDAPEAFTSRYALSQEVLFRLTTDHAQVRQRHPVSAIRVEPPDDRPYELLVGQAAAADTPGYRIVQAPTSEWSLPSMEAGRDVRAFEPAGANNPAAEFYLRLSGFLLSAREQTIEIDYRDVSTEAVHLEVYSDLHKTYTRLGRFEGRNDGRWKTLSVKVTPELLGQTGVGLLAPGPYSTMHITWLRQLAMATGDERFTEFAVKWENYLTSATKASELGK